MQLLLFEATGEDAYRQAVAGTLRDWLPGGSIQYTPHGLAWRLQWAPLRYACELSASLPSGGGGGGWLAA